MRTSNFDPVYMEFFERRLKNAILLILVVFCILILRLWFLQIVNGSTYRAKSENNRIHLQDIPAVRGKIFDRNGEILVSNRPSYDLHVIPEGIQDNEQLSESLNRLISLNPEIIEQKLKGKSRYPFRPICLKRDMPPNELAIVETHRFNLPGVMLKVKPQRHYVYNDFASHLLGYVGQMDEGQLKSGRYPGCKPGDLVGKSGVELKWQSFLNGIRGGEQAEVDASGRTIRVISRKPPVSGANILLTIDKGMQAIAQKALTDKKGAIIAVDPHNGAILTLASTPSFSPNLFIEGIDKTTWAKMASSKDFPLQNRALAGQYPPGSLFKIIVALAGLEEGVIDQEEEIICNGQYRLGQRQYHCWKKHGHGEVNLHKALVQSCDIYFYKTGKRLGIEKIAQYANKFFLGKATGFDMGQEKPGLIPTSEWKLKKYGVPWQGGETISVSIGQSFVLVTPIQMAVMIASIFNGGKLYQP
ncbi:MAG: penicillin-binding protein 2, partial [Desulfobacterales bacterium]|nr:penicillin-binding protein 2 [Desulfobacterales bacterium]